MMDLIEHPIPTQRAWLTWQPPWRIPGSQDRLAVGELAQNGVGVSFRYLDDEELAPARAVGFERYLGLPLDSPHVEELGIEVLMGRLPPRTRGDFPKMLERFGLPGGRDYSDLTLLAYTGARSMGDGFSVTETFDGFTEPFDYVFDVAHFRDYHDPENLPEAGSVVTFDRDTENQNGRPTVRILRADGSPAGYIHHLQADRVGQWVDNGQISGRVFLVSNRLADPRLFVKAIISAQDS